MNKVILVIVVFIHTQLSAQVDIDKLLKYSDSIMSYGVETYQIPGAVIGIATSDSIIMLKGYGYSDIDKKFP